MRIIIHHHGKGIGYYQDTDDDLESVCSSSFEYAQSKIASYQHSDQYRYVRQSIDFRLASCGLLYLYTQQY